MLGQALGPQLVDLGLVLVALAELLLNRLQLLPEEAALPLVDLQRDLRLDEPSSDISTAAENPGDPALSLTSRVEQLGLVFRRSVDASDASAVVDVRRGDLHFFGQVRRQSE